MPVARLRYTKSRREWTLYWSDRNSKFRRYDLVDPATNVVVLLDAGSALREELERVGGVVRGLESVL